KMRGNRIAQPIQGFAQGPAPLLVPAQAAGIAAAVATPSLDAMDAAPGSILEDLGFPSRRVLFEEFAVIRDFGGFLCFDVIERVGKRHLAVLVMMPVRFAVGGDMSKLRPGAGIGERAHQAGGEFLRIVYLFQAEDGIRDGSIVKKEAD